MLERDESNLQIEDVRSTHPNLRRRGHQPLWEARACEEKLSSGVSQQAANKCARFIGR